MSARVLSLRSISIRFLMMALIALVLASAAGCRTSPVKDVLRSPVPVNATAKDVEKAILAAGDSQGWAMKVKSPGLIVGSLSVRDHMAEVEIPYSKSSYSILYKSSANLKYDPATRSIHSNYNSWIVNLDTAIRARLAVL
jgi:hypothetical protein